MKGKKEIKAKSSKNGADENAGFENISSKTDLKNFLLNVRDKMAEEVAAPVYALSAINHVMTLPGIYNLLDNENKEIARDIWLRLKQSGMQLRNPPILFGTDTEDGAARA